jgi:hypothetical protein
MEESRIKLINAQKIDRCLWGIIWRFVMAALGWATLGGSNRALLAGTEVGVAVGPGAGRELMLIFVGRAFLLGMSVSWLTAMGYTLLMVFERL